MRATTRLNVWCLAGALATSCAHAGEPAFAISGRLNFGAVWRLEDPDPRFPYAPNGAAAGVAAFNGTGANVDDGNLNFRRHDAVSRALTGYLDVRASVDATRARVTLQAWRDFALQDGVRSWGSVANNYTTGVPLSDAGAPPLSRFAGVVVGEAWVEQAGHIQDWRLLARVGQQTLDWGANAGFGGGLEVLTARDNPGSRRAGALPAETRVAAPLVFASADTRNVGIEAFVQGRFRPNATDMCGSLFAVSDYITDGCDKVMGGAPAADDRRRVAIGAYLKRLPTPKPETAQFGAGLHWTSPGGDWRLGAWHARYTSRVAAPGLRKSLRPAGQSAFIAGDPDGKNIAFFTEYPEAIRIAALTFAHRSGAWGELSYRPNMPLLFGPGDALPPFMNATVPALLRRDADAVAPGAIFHGYERYPMLQAQIGIKRLLAPDNASAWGWSAEMVAKHVNGLPDQALRRYGRADVYGTGPVGAICNVNASLPALQCSQRGYVSATALAARGRIEARVPLPIDGLRTTMGLGYVRDLRGWSADALINEGRNTANLSLRAEYRQRYFAEIAWAPVWGGDYNATADRDVLALSMGVRF